MEISLKIIADSVMVFCFIMSFVCFKIIPTKRQLLELANDKHIKLTILGTMFLILGLIIGITHLTVELFSWFIGFIIQPILIAPISIY